MHSIWNSVEVIRSKVKIRRSRDMVAKCIKHTQQKSKSHPEAEILPSIDSRSRRSDRQGQISDRKFLNSSENISTFTAMPNRQKKSPLYRNNGG